MVVLNRLKYCGKYKGKLSDVRPSYVYRDQGKRLGFPWIPLAESGLFNGLWRIQIKIFLISMSSVANVSIDQIIRPSTASQKRGVPDRR
jgi:hypothetical protein